MTSGDIADRRAANGTFEVCQKLPQKVYEGWIRLLPSPSAVFFFFGGGDFHESGVNSRLTRAYTKGTEDWSTFNSKNASKFCLDSQVAAFSVTVAGFWGKVHGYIYIYIYIYFKKKATGNPGESRGLGATSARPQRIFGRGGSAGAYLGPLGQPGC